MPARGNERRTCASERNGATSPSSHANARPLTAATAALVAATRKRFLRVTCMVYLLNSSSQTGAIVGRTSRRQKLKASDGHCSSGPRTYFLVMVQFGMEPIL